MVMSLAVGHTQVDVGEVEANLVYRLEFQYKQDYTDPVLFA